MDKLKINEFEVIGTLKGADVKKDNSKSTGKGYVIVTAVIDSVINGVTNEYEVSFRSNEQTQKNTPNKLYEAYVNIPSMIGKKVSVQGELEENRFFSTKKNVMSSATRLRGKFIKGELNTLADKATFTVGGFVVSELVEKKNKDNQIYRYDFIMGVPNYNGTKMSAFTLHINPNEPEYVRGVSAWHSGDTVKVQGELNFTVEQVVVEDKNSGFGQPMNRVYTNRTNNFFVNSGSNPFKDETAYTMEEIRNLIEAYKANDVAIQAAAESKVSNSAVTEEAPITRRQASLI